MQANQVPCKSKVLTSSAVRIPSFSTGGTSSRCQASIVVWAPARANPHRCIGFLKNLDLMTLCRSFNNAAVWVAVGSSLAKNPVLRLCSVGRHWLSRPRFLLERVSDTWEKSLSLGEIETFHLFSRHIKDRIPLNSVDNELQSSCRGTTEE